MLEKKIEKTGNIFKSDSNFARTFIEHHLLLDISFSGYCLIKNNISIPKKIINLYISNTLNPQLRNLNRYFALGNCLFASVILTRKADLDKCKYSVYGIGFDSRSKFSLSDGSMRNNVIIFEHGLSSSMHIDNKRNNILILGEGAMQRLDDTTLTAEAKYPIKFTQS